MNWFKIASDTTPIPFVGTLQSNDTYWYLKVDDRIIVPFMQMVNNDAIDHPNSVTKKEKQIGAHITVIKGDEGEGLDIKEDGEEFEFFISGAEQVDPEGWDGVKKVYFITVDSPDLEKLRKKYDLTPKVNGDHNFHITFGVEPEMTKTASAMPFIDLVQNGAASHSKLIIYIKNKRYEYHNMPFGGESYYNQIKQLKTMPNKQVASQKVSYLIKNLEPYRAKDQLHPKKFNESLFSK